DEFAQSFNIQLYQYDDLPYDSKAEAQKLAYGERALPVLHFDKARLVVAINTDFMGTWYEPVRFQRDFMSVRKKRDQDINRLVVFESLLTLTGSNADQRYRIRPSQSLAIVMGLLNEIVVTRKASRYAHDDSVLRVISAFAKGSADLGLNLGELAEELIHNKGRSLVVTGGPLSDTEEAAALQVATSFLNAVLENDGHTIDPASSRIPGQRGQGIGELLAAIKAGQIKTLIVHRCNPVYTMPAGSPLREALAGLEMIIYTGDRNDETARYADYIATDHHALENWSDMRTPTGVLSIQQPTIQPLYRTRAFQDSLISWMKTADRGPARVKGAENWYEYLRQNWRDQLAPKVADRSFDDLWNEILEKGVVAGSATPAASRTFSVAALATVKPTARKTGFELTLYPTVALRDGSLANVSWLQELPDPVTKATWDNYVMVSPRDAAQLKLKEGQHVTLTVDGRTLTVPAHIQPGLADGAIGVALGYGRVGAGQVADGVGQNAYTLARWADGRRVFAGLETSVKVESKVTPLAITQGHHTMEGRQIVVEETLADFLAKPGGGIHRHPSGPKYEMWGGEKGHKYVGNKWGMVVDLNTCTGCSACVIACQSENNIPTVGKRYVIEGREMHWLRIDRYYTGTPEDPDTVHQPMLCQHCENAPCEVVCPVAATVHSDEGTNDMIYNRCVGTRYCSNNCPYKVRRFNWFDFTQYESPRHLALNPEVTVRNRGVMEKCTFCIHRIRYHKSQAKLEDRPLKADEFTTACAQACPTNAIIFGDLNNQESAVAQEFNKPYSYSVLSELNTKPVLHYQVSIRNAEHLKGAPKHREEGHHS
ncbi:MAG: 4Fe-4S dicluster domain-containing protein, partial [Bdellovibrionales bacterium]